MKKNTYTDTELVEQLQNNNEQAFDLLYERYYRLVYFIAYELCKNDADAKDISQEVFLQIRNSIHTLQEPERLKQWINRITVNKCKNLFRKHLDFPVEDDVIFNRQLKEDRFYMLPEKNVRFKSDQDMMKYFIHTLPYVQKEVILLRYYSNMSMSEMAEILEIPEGTVKSRLRLAKSELKKMVCSYEKLQGTPINFQVTDAAIAGAFASSLTGMSPILKHGSRKPTQWNVLTIASSISAKVAAATLLCVGVGGAYLAYDTYQKSANPSQPVHEVNKLTDTKAKQYYFQLMDWACCKEDMQQKSKDEFEEVKYIYSVLKNSSSPYYQRLVDEHWVADFEEIMKL